MEMFGLSVLLFTRLFSKTTELVLFQLAAERFYMTHWEFNVCYFGTPGAFPRRRNDYITNFNLSSAYSEIICYNFTSLNVYRVALKHMRDFISYLAWFVQYFTTLTLKLQTTTIVAPHSNASKWQMGFNSEFKGLKIARHKFGDTVWTVITCLRTYLLHGAQSFLRS